MVLMLKVNYTEVFNFEGAFRGMRNPMASWGKADSKFSEEGRLLVLGDEDRKLALKLASAGSDHGKFLRQIFVCMDITAPDYWWKEMDTYKVSTVANSTSTMHKLTSRLLTPDDFSWDKMTRRREETLQHLNTLITGYLFLIAGEDTKKAKEVWRELIQDLPMSFNYTRTWSANYENLRNIYFARKNHKLSEWHTLCAEIESLPFSELITTPRGNM
jgi:hypothetical protein